MQRTLAEHLTSLPQRTLDQCNEIQLLAMIQEDVKVLDGVIGAFFDLVSSSLKLLFLVPVMALLSTELTAIVILTVPIFLIQQLCLGDFTSAIALKLRDSEAAFFQMIEENLMFVKTKKLLGLEKFLNNRLLAQQKAVVREFDVLDLLNARNDRRLLVFNLFLEKGITLLGVALMHVKKDDWVNLTLGGDNFPPKTCISEYFFSQDGDASGFGSGTDDSSTTEYVITIAVLFSIISSLDEVTSLCVELVGCIRAMQTGRTSMARVQFYLDQDPDPWPEHARRLRKKKRLQAVEQAESRAAGGVSKCAA
eukprot:6860962-Prymnesium_polylepis.1